MSAAARLVHLHLRVPASFIPRAERIAEVLAEQHGDDPLKAEPSRSTAMRAALARGLDVLERELGIAPAG